MKNFWNRFVHEEDGAEMVEWAIVIAIAAVIAVPVLALVRIASSKVNDASELIGNINPAEYISQGNGGGGGTGTGAGSGGTTTPAGRAGGTGGTNPAGSNP